MPKIELDETECGQVIDTNLSSVTYFLKWTNDQARSRSFPYQCLLQRDSSAYCASRHDVARLDKVAGSVLWLISETSSYVTGVIISVNAVYSLIGARIIRSDVMKSHCYRARIELCSLFLAHIPGS